jgi:predicted secreted protein
MLAPVTIAAIYAIVWFVTLFIVLPFGVRNQVDTGQIVRGTEPGAPVAPRLWRRILVTSLLSAVLTGLLLWGLTNETLQRYWS